MYYMLGTFVKFSTHYSESVDSYDFRGVFNRKVNTLPLVFFYELNATCICVSSTWCWWVEQAWDIPLLGIGVFLNVDERKLNARVCKNQCTVNIIFIIISFRFMGASNFLFKKSLLDIYDNDEKYIIVNVDMDGFACYQGIVPNDKWLSQPMDVCNIRCIVVTIKGRKMVWFSESLIILYIHANAKHNTDKKIQIFINNRNTHSKWGLNLWPLLFWNFRYQTQKQ